MEDKLRQAYLYDFYGELLNEHQRRIYEDFVFQDLSLGEIAEEEGISRQGVADMVKRCGRKLNDYEDKLHLVAKFQLMKADIEHIRTLAYDCRNNRNNKNDEIMREDEIMLEIETISNRILKEL